MTKKEIKKYIGKKIYSVEYYILDGGVYGIKELPIHSVNITYSGKDFEIESFYCLDACDNIRLDDIGEKFIKDENFNKRYYFSRKQAELCKDYLNKKCDGEEINPICYYLATRLNEMALQDNVLFKKFIK